MPGISSLDSQHDIPNLKESKRLILYYENGSVPENVKWLWEERAVQVSHSERLEERSGEGDVEDMES